MPKKPPYPEPKGKAGKLYCKKPGNYGILYGKAANTGMQDKNHDGNEVILS